MTVVKDRERELVDTVMNCVNSCSLDYNRVAELIGNQHRTLQQCYTKLCIAWLKHLSQVEYYDLRNEASVKFAKSISKQMDSMYLPLI